ncbi:MAG: hypothetical protein QOJ19_4893 [Acidimicrobiia bacterium]|jgi:hypothetical protein|nr:hypothetical protein [Acidimicrobiia bacterium]
MAQCAASRENCQKPQSHDDQKNRNDNNDDVHQGNGPIVTAEPSSTAYFCTVWANRQLQAQVPVS